jgi:hypothetical protein
MSGNPRERSREEKRRSSLRWMELEWEGATTAAQEEKRKEEVIAVFRALAEDSKRGAEVRKFVARWGAPW